MSANSWNDNALRDMQKCDETRESRQAIEAAEVTEEAWEENPRKCGDSPAAHLVISNNSSDMQTFGARAMRSEFNKTIALNYLRGMRSDTIEEKTALRRQSSLAPSSLAPSRLMRWCRFNVVGGIGIMVQFAALFVLKSVLHFNYLFATVVAVEAAVVHNFVWHEQFTWADRVKTERTKLDRSKLDRTMIDGAQMNQTKTDRTTADRIHSLRRRSLLRLLRFNLTTGAVSILGNLALMKVMVGQGHMNYLLADAVAIILCSLANFLVSETWVFAAD